MHQPLRFYLFLLKMEIKIVSIISKMQTAFVYLCTRMNCECMLKENSHLFIYDFFLLFWNESCLKDNKDEIIN
jgi:hypothetical protein